MKLQDARKMALDLMGEHGLIDRGWRFDFDNARNRLGVTRFGLKKISLSKSYVGLNGKLHVRDTILHEIAHALTPNAGHNLYWKVIAKQIGCNAERTNHDAILPPSKYVGYCPNNHEHSRQKLTKNAGRGSCASCSSVYDERYLIKWRLRGEP